MYCFAFINFSSLVIKGTFLILLMALANNFILVAVKETITTSDLWKPVKADALWISQFQLKKISNLNSVSYPWMRVMSK